MASSPFEFDLAGVHVEGMVKKIKLSDRLVLQNDFSSQYVQGGDRIGFEPNVARSKNRVMAFALESLSIGGTPQEIDENDPLSKIDEDNDEFEDYFVDELLKAIVNRNRFLGRKSTEENPNPLEAIYGRYMPKDAAKSDPTRSASSTMTGGASVVPMHSGSGTSASSTSDGE